MLNDIGQESDISPDSENPTRRRYISVVLGRINMGAPYTVDPDDAMMDQIRGILGDFALDDLEIFMPGRTFIDEGATDWHCRYVLIDGALPDLSGHPTVDPETPDYPLWLPVLDMSEAYIARTSDGAYALYMLVSAEGDDPPTMYRIEL